MLGVSLRLRFPRECRNPKDVKGRRDPNNAPANAMNVWRPPKQDLPKASRPATETCLNSKESGHDLFQAFQTQHEDRLHTRHPIQNWKNSILHTLKFD